jgi:polyadenylate-binding protein
MKSPDQDTVDDGLEQAFFVAGLSTETSENELFQLFEALGNVSSVKVLKDSLGKSRRSAIVKIKNADVDEVLALHKTRLGEKRIRVKICTGRRKDQKVASSVVFVGNVHCKSTEDSIGKEFEVFGKIKEIRFPRDFRGNLKGSCYVEFFDVEAAENAMKMNKCVIDGKIVRVDLAEGRTEEKKKNWGYHWALDPADL